MEQSEIVVLHCVCEVYMIFPMGRSFISPFDRDGLNSLVSEMEA